MINKNSNRKCWICKDSGFVFVTKNIFGSDYEFAYRCKCINGQVSSKTIKTVPDGLAEKIAMENYKRIG